MSQLSKIIASLLVVIALLMTVVAIYFLVQPKPAPVVPLPIQATTAPIQAPEPEPIPLFNVVVARGALKAGTQLSGDTMKIEQWPIQPEQSFTQLHELEGEFIRIDLAMGELIQPSMLMKGLAHYIAPGERALTIPIIAPHTQASRIQAGDMVDVFVFLKKQLGEVDLSQARLLLAKKRVLAIGGHSVDGPLPENSRGGTDQSNTAVLAVPVEDVNTLLLASREGALQLVVRSPFDDALPDLALFPERHHVLDGKNNLSPSQRELLSRPENKAFAGDSLTELGASEVTTSPSFASRSQPSAAPTSRATPKAKTIEVIRGPHLQLEHY